MSLTPRKRRWLSLLCVPLLAIMPVACNLPQIVWPAAQSPNQAQSGQPQYQAPAEEQPQPGGPPPGEPQPGGPPPGEPQPGGPPPGEPQPGGPPPGEPQPGEPPPGEPQPGGPPPQEPLPEQPPEEPAPQEPGCAGPPQFSGFTANPGTITAGQSVTLSWGNVTNGGSGPLVRSLTLEPGFGEVGSGAGSRTIKPQQTTTYILTATGCGGTAKMQLTVNVNSPMPVATVLPIQPPQPLPVATVVIKP